MHERLWTKDYLLLSLSNGFLFLGFELLLPTLPIYIANHGGTASEVGLIMGIFTFSAILIRFFAEAGSQKMGEKNFLLLGIAICFLATGGYFWGVTVLLALLIRVFHGFGFGIATNLFGTMVTHVIPRTRMGEGMGYFGLGTTIMMSIAPFLGVWLIQSYSFGVLFACAAATQLISLLFTQMVSGSAQHAEDGVARNRERSWLHHMVETKALFPSLLVMLVGFCEGGVLGFITLFGQEIGISNVGWFFLVNAACVILIRLVSGRIYDRKGQVWVLLPGALFILVGLVLLSRATSLPTLMLAAVFFGIGTGALFPSLQAWAMQLVAPERQGVATGTFYNLFDVGIGVGAILLGLVAQQSSYANVYLVSSLFMVIYLGVYGWYLLRKNKATAPR